MSTNLISVIIPVYNTAQYLPRCLDSILNNTYRELEVLCVNDGSTDDSLEVLNRYAACDSRVRVIDQKNGGVSAARNHGLDEATGAYVAFVDSDDWVHRQYFEVLWGASQSQDSHITVCGYTMTSEVVADQEIDCDGLRIHPVSHEQMASADIPSWGRLYRREAIGHARFDREITLAEDTVFNLEVLRMEPDLRLARCEAPMYYYFTRQDSLVHTLPDSKFAPLVRYYLGTAQTNSDDTVKNACLIRAFKTLFLWRYRASFQEHPDGDDVLRELLGKACALLGSAERIGKKTRVCYQIMARCPALYRLFRILTDPSMLGWEKLQRERARERKKQK